MAQTVKTTGRATCVETTEGERYLVVDINIDCPGCGVFTIQLAGHHLRAVRSLLNEFLDAYPEPELTGREEDMMPGERMAFGGAVGDPTKN